MMSLKKAELILMSNLKGSKNKLDAILDIAEAVNVVKKHYSVNDITNMYQITSTSVDRINSINKLNICAKNLIKQEKIKIEQAYHLSRLNGKRQDEAANIITTMNAHNTRIFIKMLLAEPNKSVHECKKSFRTSNMDDVSVVVVPMPNDMYKNLEKNASLQKKTVHDVILDVMENYIGK